MLSVLEHKPNSIEPEKLDFFVGKRGFDEGFIVILLLDPLLLFYFLISYFSQKFNDILLVFFQKRLQLIFLEISFHECSEQIYSKTHLFPLDKTTRCARLAHEILESLDCSLMGSSLGRVPLHSQPVVLRIDFGIAHIVE